MKKSTKILIGIGSTLVIIFIVLISIGSYLTSESNPGFQQLLQKIEANDPGAISNSSINISLIPMYGGFEKTPAQLKSDEEFIKTAVAEAGSRENASILIANGAKEWFEQGDLDTAIKRYNQAWLLDNNNPNVYIGFGDILKKQGHEKEAEDMYNQAEELKNKL